MWIIEFNSEYIIQNRIVGFYSTIRYKYYRLIFTLEVLWNAVFGSCFCDLIPSSAALYTFARPE